MLRAAILHECQNYLGGGGGLAGGEKNILLAPSPHTRAIILDARPSVHLKIKVPVTVRRGISKRSREKIGDCEQSMHVLTALLMLVF